MPQFIPAKKLLDLTGGDRLVEALITNGRLTDGAWADSGTYVWSMPHWGDPGIMGIGEPARGAAMLLSLMRDQPDVSHRVSLPPGWQDLVDPALRVAPYSAWDWFWTTSVPTSTSDEAGAQWLTDDDTADVQAVLDDAMPDASARPGDDRVRRWAGIRDRSGALVATLADTSISPQVGHLSSVATVTEHQGNGYGAALTTWVTREILREGANMVTLGMYADNDKARRFYQRLGFTCEHRFSTAIVTYSAVT